VPAESAEGRFGQIRRWLLSSPVAAWRDREILAERWDMMIALSPLTAMALPILRAASNARHRYCYITDFFPLHHADLGLLPRGIVTRVATSIESILLRRFDVVGCMSPMGLRFLKCNYRLAPGQKSEVLHLWSNLEHPPVRERRPVRDEWDLPQDAVIAVFGGQLAPGRSLDALRKGALAAKAAGDRIVFLVVGEGPGREELEDTAKGCRNLLLRKGVPRDRYFELLTACDVGIVATTSSVSAPTFPSKTIDYLRAGLPIVATTEQATDYGAFLENHRVGVSLTNSDPQMMLEAIRKLCTSQGDRDCVSLRTQALARQLFSADRAAEQVLSHLGA
jgi:glycosyltransferase involved in cell wall biosynthesis